MSILTGPAIRAAIASEIIAITPHDDDQIDQAGVTLHLHPTASHARAALETVSRPVLATGADLVPLGWEERWCAGTAAVSLQPSPALCAKGGT